MDPNQIALSQDQMVYAAIVGSWWFALLKKAFVAWAAFEFSLAMSRRLDHRAHGRAKSFGQILDEVRGAASAGLGIYYGLRELGRCVFIAAVVFIA